MIRGIDDHGVLGHLRVGSQRGENLADFIVHPVCKPVIQFTSPLHDVVRDADLFKGSSKHFVVGRKTIKKSIGNYWHCHLAAVAIPVLLWHNERKMWREKSGKQDRVVATNMRGFRPATREHAGTARNAERRRAVGPVEGDPTRRKFVQRRTGIKRITLPLRKARSVLIRYDENDVRLAQRRSRNWS